MVMNFLRKLMYGRYGSDQLSLFLLVVYVLLILLSGLPHMGWLSWLALVVLVWDLFRMFSRRIDRRRAENARFLALAGPVVRWLRLRHNIHRDKEHRYFKCPNCGQYLRVPRGKGRSPSPAATAAPALRSGAEHQDPQAGAHRRPVLRPLQGAEKLIC